MKSILQFIFIAVMLIPSLTSGAPDEKTLQWEKRMISLLSDQLCNATSGSMVKMFNISSVSCMKTVNYAAAQCTKAIHQIPYYYVKDSGSGALWGRLIGYCVGHAYDLKYTSKDKNIP